MTDYWGVTCLSWMGGMLLGFALGRGLFVAAEPKSRLQVYTLQVTPEHAVYVHRMTDAQARDISRLIIAGRALTYRALTGTGKPFTRGEWDAAKRELLDRGILAINQVTGEVYPTPPGRAFARACLSMHAHTQHREEMK